jgi:hypothetical protein
MNSSSGTLGPSRWTRRPTITGACRRLHTKFSGPVKLLGYMVITSGLLDPAALNVDSGFSGASRNGLNPEFGRIHEKGHVLGVDNDFSGGVAICRRYSVV